MPSKIVVMHHFNVCVSEVSNLSTLRGALFLMKGTVMYKYIDFLLAIVDLLNAIAIFIILMILAIMLPSFLTEVTNFISVIIQPYH